nr:hypothetical protein [Actinomycetota bacterium]
TAAAVALLIVVFVGDVTMSDSFDAARWRAGQVGVASGVSATDVDAGFEWVGFHYSGIAGPSSLRRSQVTPPGYMFYFPRSGACIMVSATPLPAPDNVQVGKVAYRGTFLLGSNELFVYRNKPACELAS